MWRSWLKGRSRCSVSGEAAHCRPTGVAAASVAGFPWGGLPRAGGGLWAPTSPTQPAVWGRHSRTLSCSLPEELPGKRVVSAPCCAWDELVSTVLPQFLAPGRCLISVPSSDGPGLLPLCDSQSNPRGLEVDLGTGWAVGCRQSTLLVAPSPYPVGSRSLHLPGGSFGAPALLLWPAGQRLELSCCCFCSGGGAGEYLGNLLHRTCLHSLGPLRPHPRPGTAVSSSLRPHGPRRGSGARSERRGQAPRWPRALLPKEA